MEKSSFIRHWLFDEISFLLPRRKDQSSSHVIFTTDPYYQFLGTLGRVKDCIQVRTRDARGVASAFLHPP